MAARLKTGLIQQKDETWIFVLYQHKAGGFYHPNPVYTSPESYPSKNKARMAASGAYHQARAYGVDSLI